MRDAMELSDQDIFRIMDYSKIRQLPKPATCCGYQIQEDRALDGFF